MASSGAPVVDGYERRIGRYGGALARALTAVTGVQRGERVLDVGCGTGALTACLAEITGPDAVVGVDPDAAAVRTAAERLSAVRFDVAPAEALPYGDAEFDAVLAQLVVSLMDDADRGVAEMRRVARPGGRVSTCVWDFGGGMTVLRTFWDAAAAVDPAGAATHDQAATRPYATRAELEDLWRRAGFDDVASGELVVTAAYADADDAWEPMEIPDGGPGVYLQSLERERRAAIRREFLDRLGRPTGAFELPARAWYVCGRAPLDTDRGFSR